MGINWSDRQKDVIYADDDRLLVSASAGSGKTTVMIERILRLIGDGAKLANMLICTFTKASAADMRLKLYEKMCERGLKDELKELARADISTIDSFCQRIVSKYFYVLGIDPLFEVIDEDESKALKSEAARKSIELNRQNDDFAQLYEILLNKRKCTVLQEAILDIMDFKSINPSCDLRFIEDERSKEKIDEILTSRTQKLYDYIDDFFNHVYEPVAKADIISALELRTSPQCKTLKDKASKKYSEYYKYLKNEVRQLNSLKSEVDELKEQALSRQYIEALITAANDAEKIYSDEKNRRAVVDFADLEHMTLAVLQSDASPEIRAKYKYVFVDEYQDINPLQESLISLVSEGNRLFMVGDIKQSIYAFRGCEPAIFKDKYDRYLKGDGGRVIQLDTNFRSGKKIIDFVNKVFGEIMTENFGGIDYKLNPMSSFTCKEDKDDKEDTENKDGYVKFNIVTGGEKGDKDEIYSVKRHMGDKMSMAEAEALLIAHRVQELLKSDIDYGEIAILTRGMGTLESLVVNKLRQIGVPVSLTEKADFLLRPETGQLIAYLRLVDNRYDDKALAEAMLSPFGGFNENELATFAGGKCFFENVYSSNGDKVKGFLDRLDRYSALKLTKGVDELADMIVSETGYFNYAFGLGDDAAEVLDKFLEFLGNCPNKNSLSACLKYIDEHRPSAELKGDDISVKLMTIHKSKGLEFNYVFVIGLSGTFNLRDLNGKVIVGDPITMCVYDNHVAYNSDMRFLACERERKKMLEEEMRILYVAFTRAKKGLELFASMSKDAAELISAYENAFDKSIFDYSQFGCALKWLCSQVFWAKKYELDEIELEDVGERKVLISGADEDKVKSLKEYFAFAPDKRAPAKSYVSKLAHKDDEPSVYLTEETTSGNALERGNAYHRAMEALDFANPNLDVLDKNDLALIDADKLLVAASKMNSFAGKAYKEKPFMLKSRAAEIGLAGEGDVLVQGVIDLMYIDDDEATIIDYKTGQIHGTFEEGYIKQVNLYAKAVERLLGKKVVGKYLYYFDAETFVEIS